MDEAAPVLIFPDDVGKAGRVFDCKADVGRGAAEVRVDHQGFGVLLRVHHREIASEGGFAFARGRGGDEDGVDRVVDVAEQDGFADGADCFVVGGLKAMGGVRCGAGLKSRAG